CTPVNTCKDLCLNVKCNNSEIKCPDGSISSCQNTCDPKTGLCTSCTPICNESIDRKFQNQSFVYLYGSGGGGGESSAGDNKEKQREKEEILYFVIPEEINLELKQKELKKFNLTIINNGSKDINLLFISDTENIKAPSSLYLLNKEMENVSLDIIGPKDIGIYKENITIMTEGKDKKIPVTLNVISGALFDVVVRVLPQYKKIYPGKDVRARVELINMGYGRVDVYVKSYITKKGSNEEILSQSKWVAVETKLELLEELTLPDNIKRGEYTFNTLMTYNNITLIGHDNFYVVMNPFWILILALIGLIFLILIILLIRNRRKKTERIRSLKMKTAVGELKDELKEREEIERKRNLILINKLNELTNESIIHYKKNELEDAKNKYEEVRNIYKDLSLDYKKKFYPKGIKLYNLLKEKIKKIPRLEEPE
ncbi:MAG: hypothetical protein QW117_00950, partial [Candidatus Pacearchaeota archaeon]